MILRSDPPLELQASPFNQLFSVAEVANCPGHGLIPRGFQAVE